MAVGATYVAFLSQMPPEVVLGSFTGAVIFLLGVKDKPKWQWMLLFTVAFMAGLLGGKGISDLIEAMLNLVKIQVRVPHGMGAMMSASCTISFISWIRDNPTYFFRKAKKEEQA